MRRVHDPERAAQERDKPLASAAPVSHAARIIALQRTVGNHAVAAMLAREAKPKAAEPAHGLAIVEGLGTIPLIAVQLGELRKSADREKPAASQEITVMSKMGDQSAALALASQHGDVFEVELFVGEKLHLKLHKAMVSMFQENGHGADGPVDSWVLNAESIEFVTDER
jgi:hypothetical protein